LDLVEGEQVVLNAQIMPLDAYDTTVTWSSTNDNIATVNESGIITAVGSGKAAIICTANDGSGANAVCAVNVERFLQLDDSLLEFYVYTSGNNHSNLGIVNLTLDSEKRISSSGLNVTWALEKTSGTACDIAVEEFQAEAEKGVTVSGNRIKLLRINDVGTDEYVLSCHAGNYEDNCIIRIRVIQTELPEEVSLTRGHGIRGILRRPLQSITLTGQLAHLIRNILISASQVV